MSPPATASPSLPRLDRPAVYGPQGRSPWLDVDWHEHQRWIILDGQPVNVIELGASRADGRSPIDGPPLVFVHGLAGSWPNWLEQLPVFAAAGHRVIALDLPGFGHSPMPTERISISGYARLLDRLLDRLDIDAAAVVGNSMGGFVSAELAIAFPQRVERLVLVSPAGLSTYRPGATRTLARLQRLERIIAARAAWVASKSEAVARRPRLREATLSLVTRHPDRLGAALAAEQLRGAGKPGFMQALAAHLEYDFRDRLQEIACPTLIVWGEDDRVVTVRDSSVFTELIPNSRAVIYKDTGHLAMLERPVAFNALLEEFLGE